MQEFSNGAKKRMTLSDKVVGIVAILSLLGGIAVTYSDNNSKLTEHSQAISSLWAKFNSLEGIDERTIRLEEKVDSFRSTQSQTLEVLQRLAESVDKLSVSVGRLDERTQSLERERQ